MAALIPAEILFAIEQGDFAGFVAEQVPDSLRGAWTLEKKVAAAITSVFGAGIATDEVVRAVAKHPKVRSADFRNEDFITPDKKKPKKANISPDETTKKLSFDNLPTSTDMSAPGGTRRINSGGDGPARSTSVMATLTNGDPRNVMAETDVSTIPLYATLSTPWPDTVQIYSRYYKYNTTGSIPSGTTGNLQTISLRTNSWYDCYLDAFLTHTADATPGAAPSADSKEVTPNYGTWYNYYRTYYNYWTVVQANVTVRFRNTTYNKKGELAVYRYVHGREIPAYYSTGSTAIDHIYKRTHPNMGYKFVSANESVTEATAAGYKYESNLNNNWVTFNDVMKPGDTPHEVVEDELLETWTRFDEIPATPEYFTFHIQRSPRSDDITMTYDSEIEIEYVVQMKDLKNTYRYTMNTTDQAAITDPQAMDV